MLLLLNVTIIHSNREKHENITQNHWHFFSCSDGFRLGWVPYFFMLVYLSSLYFALNIRNQTRCIYCMCGRNHKASFSIRGNLNPSLAAVWTALSLLFCLIYYKYCCVAVGRRTHSTEASPACLTWGNDSGVGAVSSCRCSLHKWISSLCRFSVRLRRKFECNKFSQIQKKNCQNWL